MSPAVGLVAAAWCVVVGVGLIFGDSPCGRKGGRPGKGRGGTARPENERPLLDALSTLWSVTKGIVFTLVSLAALPVTVGLPVALSCGCALLPPDFTLRLPCSARRYRPRRWVDRLRLFAYIEFCAPRVLAPTPSAAACDPLPLQPPSSPPWGRLCTRRLLHRAGDVRHAVALPSLARRPRLHARPAALLRAARARRVRRVLRVAGLPPRLAHAQPELGRRPPVAPC